MPPLCLIAFINITTIPFYISEKHFYYVNNIVLGHIKQHFRLGLCSSIWSGTLKVEGFNDVYCYASLTKEKTALYNQCLYVRDNNQYSNKKCVGSISNNSNVRKCQYFEKIDPIFECCEMLL